VFAQVIEARVKDQQGLRARMDEWVADLAAGATGWLGSTAGVTDDGTLLAVVRFESEEAARTNSDRPEQGEWWARTTAHLDGEATFVDCPVVDLFGAGGSDDAGFVQVIQGRADREQVLGSLDQTAELLARLRPDVLGGLMAWPGDGTFTQVVYFSNEADARKGEQAELSPEDAAALQGQVGMLQAERFVDLRDPWLASA
jgi:hypothetical protein